MVSHVSNDKQDTNSIRAEIRIHQHYEFRVYSPEWPLQGDLVVTSDHDVTFDELHISLIGKTATHNYVQPDPTCATVEFIKLCMPCDYGAFANGNVFNAGQAYAIPFHFVIPRQVPVDSCRHDSISLSLQERHVQLPPTMGHCPGNDQSPEAAQISYSIKGVALKHSTSSGDPITLFTAEQTVRVLSSGPEEAPLDCSTCETMYKLTTTKRFWKGLLMDTGGKLTATAWQPKMVMLSADGRTAASGSIHLGLAFAPTSARLLPVKVHSVSGKLISQTFYNVVPIDHSPALETDGRYGIRPYCHTVSHRLFHAPMGELQWATNFPGNELKQHVSTSCSFTGQQGQWQGQQEHQTRRRSLPWTWKPLEEPKVQYTTELDIPFAIPHGTKNFFLPSFDTCSISRTYSLKMTLRVGPAHGKLTLLLPIQIGVEAAMQGTQSALTRGRSNANTGFGRLEADYLEEPPSYTARL